MYVYTPTCAKMEWRIHDSKIEIMNIRNQASACRNIIGLYTHIQTYAHAHKYTQTQTHVRTPTYTHTHRHIRIYMYKHVYVHI